MSKFLQFKTLYQGPLRDFELEVLKQSSEIEAWFDRRWKSTPAVFTTSVDLRVSHHQIVPIDTNIFPAGFNNLTEEMRALVVNAIKLTMSGLSAKANSVLILTENHTRNPFYLESVNVLSSCFTAAGFQVSVLALDDFKSERLRADVVILNHDLSTGYPSTLQHLNCPIFPSPYLGWWNRSKFIHFSSYFEIIHDFCQTFSLDRGNFFTPCMKVDAVDFMKKTGFEKLAEAVDKLAESKPPFVTIKADQGTYGMSVMMVRSGEEILAMNRRQRSHMAARKGGEKVDALLVQAGVETIEKNETHSAEPVVYLIGSEIVGGFYRVHPAQSATESLNSPGMYFKPCLLEHTSPGEFSAADRFYVYGVVARLAALAAAMESLSLGLSQNGTSHLL